MKNYTFWAILKIVTKISLKNPWGALVVIAVGVIPYAAIYAVDLNTYTDYPYFLGGLIAMTIVVAGIVHYGQTMFEMKNTGILQRIRIMGVSRLNLLLISSITFLFIIFAELILIFVINLIIAATKEPSTRYDFGTVNYGLIILSIVITSFVSMSMGYFNASISKRNVHYGIATGLSIALISVFGRMYYDPSTIVWEWVKALKFAIPQSYSANLIGDSIVNNLNNMGLIQMNIWAPLGFATGFFALGIRFNKWV